MPDINEVSNARQRTVAVETGGQTYRLRYDPNRFTEGARLAYVAGVANKQAIRAVWTLLSTLLTAWDVTVAGEPWTSPRSTWRSWGRSRPRERRRGGTPPSRSGRRGSERSRAWPPPAQGERGAPPASPG
jgi:hypothetical protein